MRHTSKAGGGGDTSPPWRTRASNVEDTRRMRGGQGREWAVRGDTWGGRHLATMATWCASAAESARPPSPGGTLFGEGLPPCLCVSCLAELLWGASLPSLENARASADSLAASGLGILAVGEEPPACDAPAWVSRLWGAVHATRPCGRAAAGWPCGAAPVPAPVPVPSSRALAPAPCGSELCCRIACSCGMARFPMAACRSAVLSSAIRLSTADSDACPRLRPPGSSRLTFAPSPGSRT